MKGIYDQAVTDCQDELNDIESEVHRLEDRFSPLQAKTRTGQTLSSLNTAVLHSDSRRKIADRKNNFEKAKEDLEQFQFEFDPTYLPVRGITVSKAPFGFATATLILIGLYVAESTFNIRL